ncbi:acyl carrier protein [Streptomyces sp. ISL-11]|uniref:acyl carrier protein n=1 Tax=Streptomyces sp. ISL-11 TaxID=2819174 RepID=UPI001BEAC67C|nr:acyl carrier protein [Streptomyces sp. ISL-11]MBT2383958.1 acyl carrier protein [Streptomyces sp. ISL-11]
MFGRKKEAQPTGPLTEESLRQWLVDHLAKRIEVSPSDIDTAKSFEAYGLDSRVAVQVSGSLEKIVERRLSPGLLYEHQTIDDLSRYLAKELRLSDRTG